MQLELATEEQLQRMLDSIQSMREQFYYSSLNEQSSRKLSSTPSDERFRQSSSAINKVVRPMTTGMIRRVRFGDNPRIPVTGRSLTQSALRRAVLSVLRQEYEAIARDNLRRLGYAEASQFRLRNGPFIEAFEGFATEVAKQSSQTFQTDLEGFARNQPAKTKKALLVALTPRLEAYQDFKSLQMAHSLSKVAEARGLVDLFEKMGVRAVYSFEGSLGCSVCRAMNESGPHPYDRVVGYRQHPHCGCRFVVDLSGLSLPKEPWLGD